MKEVLMIKIVIIFCMVVSAGFAGYLPVINPSLHENQNMLSIGNCFAGGIFLIVGVAGLLPDAQKSFDEDLGGSMPLGFVLAVMGYIIIFFIENSRNLRKDFILYQKLQCLLTFRDGNKIKLNKIDHNILF